MWNCQNCYYRISYETCLSVCIQKMQIYYFCNYSHILTSMLFLFLFSRFVLWVSTETSCTAANNGSLINFIMDFGNGKEIIFFDDLNFPIIKWGTDDIITHAQPSDAVSQLIHLSVNFQSGHIGLLGILFPFPQCYYFKIFFPVCLPFFP